MATHFTGPILNKDQNRGPREWFSKLPSGQEPDYSVYFNDFLVAQDYAATDWVVTTTEAGGGDASEAIAADERCGALLITNDSNDNDLDALQSAEEFIKLSSGKRVWFETRLKINDVDQVDMFVGAAITDTTALDASDRVGFRITDESAVINYQSIKNSSGDNSSSGVSAVDDTYITLGFYSDGAGQVEFYVDRAKVGTATTVPDDENLALTIHFQNGEASAQTCTIDYFYVCQER